MNDSNKLSPHVPVGSDLGRLGAQTVNYRRSYDLYVEAALQDIEGDSIFSRPELMGYLTDPTTLTEFDETLAPDAPKGTIFRAAMRSSLWASERIIPMIDRGRKESGYYIYPRDTERHHTIVAAVDLLLARVVQADASLEEVGVYSRLPRSDVQELAQAIDAIPGDAYRRDLFWAIVAGHPRTSFDTGTGDLLHVHKPHILKPPRTINAALDRIVESSLTGVSHSVGRETTFLGLAVLAFGGRLVTGLTLSRLRKALIQDSRFHEVPDTGYGERFTFLLAPESPLLPRSEAEETRQLQRVGKAVARHLLQDGVTSINGSRLIRLLHELHQGSAPLSEDEVRRIIALTPAFQLPDDSESLEAAFIGINTGTST